MKFSTLMKTIVFCSFYLLSLATNAHFGAVIPQNDIISSQENPLNKIELKFFHPFEGHLMNMERPKNFSLFFGRQRMDLTEQLREKKVGKYSTWETDFKFTRPGNYTFVMTPKPYWEPSEDCYIIHYTKVVVNNLGLEEGWDNEVGIKTEIVPLNRPFGLWAGNSFQGIVKLDGKVVPFAEVEVEYLNQGKKVKAPTDSYITQVIKADKNGVFTYTMPKAGWWGFAALNTAKYKLDHNGKKKDVELGAVLWVQTRDM